MLLVIVPAWSITALTYVFLLFKGYYVVDRDRVFVSRQPSQAITTTPDDNIRDAYPVGDIFIDGAEEGEQAKKIELTALGKMKANTTSNSSYDIV